MANVSDSGEALGSTANTAMTNVIDSGEALRSTAKQTCGYVCELYALDPENMYS